MPISNPQGKAAVPSFTKPPPGKTRSACSRFDAPSCGRMAQLRLASIYASPSRLFSIVICAMIILFERSRFSGKAIRTRRFSVSNSVRPANSEGAVKRGSKEFSADRHVPSDPHPSPMAQPLKLTNDTNTMAEHIRYRIRVTLFLSTKPAFRIRYSRRGSASFQGASHAEVFSVLTWLAATWPTCAFPSAASATTG